VAFECEFGIQFHLPTSARRHAAPDLVRVAALAHEAGFQQIWATDNLCVRNLFVVLSAVAARVPIRLGAAVLVPYFRNPVDVADALATISELMDGRELAVGIARGNIRHTPQQVRTLKPLAVLRESAQCLRRLLAGDRVEFRDFPVLASYFNLHPDEAFQLAFRPRGPVPLLGGGNGPQAAAIAGRHFDGLMYGPTFIAAVHAGRVPGVLAVARDAARDVSAGKALRLVAEVNVALAADARRARAFARDIAAGMVTNVHRMGYTADELSRLGASPEQAGALDDAYRRGARPEEIAGLVTDAMIDATVIAGDLDACKPRLVEICRTAVRQGFQQVMFSKLGPDYGESVRLLARALW